MNRRLFLLLATLSIPLVASAQTPSLGSLTSGLKDPLLKLLTNRLGVTEYQSKGGIGAYLTLAQESSRRATSTASPRSFPAPRSTWRAQRSSAPSPAH